MVRVGVRASLVAHAITISCLDYANSVLFGSPITVLQVLQHAQNSLVHVILQADRSASSTSLLQQLHWLPVEKESTSNWHPSPTKPWPLDLQLISSSLTPYDPVCTLCS